MFGIWGSGLQVVLLAEVGGQQGTGFKVGCCKLLRGSFRKRLADSGGCTCRRSSQRRDLPRRSVISKL